MSVWLFIPLFISTNARLLNFKYSQEKLNERKRSYQDQSPPHHQGKQEKPQWGSFATLGSLPSRSPLPSPAHTGSKVEPSPFWLSRSNVSTCHWHAQQRRRDFWDVQLTQGLKLELLVLLMAELLSFCGEAVSCGSSKCSCLTSQGMADKSKSTGHTNDEF